MMLSLETQVYLTQAHQLVLCSPDVAEETMYVASYFFTVKESVLLLGLGWKF